MSTIHMITLSSVLSVAASSLCLAQELNNRQNISPGTGAKINRMQAETMRQGAQADMKKPLTAPAKCGANVGNVYVPKGSTAPREVNTFVKGDVVSVCK